MGTSETIELARLQKWFLTVLLTPPELEHGLRQASSDLGIDVADIVAPTEGRNPSSRLAIYSNSYILRLVGCLEADYPVLRAHLGEELFRLFAVSFLWERPSQSPTLGALGGGFAEFLAKTQPPIDEGALALPVDLARIERIRGEVLRARGLEAGEISIVQDANLSQYVITPPCLQQVAIRYRLIEMIEAALDLNVEIQSCTKDDCIVAISRMNFCCVMEYITPLQSHFLKVAKEAQTIEAILVDLEQRTNESIAVLAPKILAWVPFATARGLLQVIDPNRPRTRLL
jgi:hypothetical protein